MYNTVAKPKTRRAVEYLRVATKEQLILNASTSQVNKVKGTSNH